MFDGEEVFCAGESSSSNSACYGDSGGPVLKYVTDLNTPHYQLVG